MPTPILRTFLPSKGGRATRIGTLLLVSVLLVILLFASLSTAFAFDEEPPLPFYDPHEGKLSVSINPTDTVSSVHFDLVGALAIAAGFSEEDANTLMIYSQLTDKSELPWENPTYAFDADPANYQSAPTLRSVEPSVHCPDPDNTTQQVMMGISNTLMECLGCFTSRMGPYAVFFHFPTDDDLGKIEAWAFSADPEATLKGRIIYGYSSTVPYLDLMPPEVYTATNIANVYKSTACFVEDIIGEADGEEEGEIAFIDTGSVKAGSLEAFGIYLHALGDAYSHSECIEETTKKRGYLFAAHVFDPEDPILTQACGWLSHSDEFGDPEQYPDSQITYEATVALYNAMLTWVETVYDGEIYKPIGLDDFDGHIDETLQRFAYSDPNLPHQRRAIADELRAWAAATRAADPRYWLDTITVCADGCDHTTIGAALDAASAGDTIAVWPGTYAETITLKAGVRLQGVPGLAVIDGNGSGPVVTITGSDVQSDTVLSGFTITGGAAENGAGIYVADGAAPTLSALVVQGNEATANGGGLFAADTSAPRLSVSTFYSNTAASGAALYAAGAPVHVEGNAFELNVASGSGGALVLNNTIGTVRNNAFLVNVASGSGGAIYIAGGSPVVENNVIAGFNSASESGGGIAIDGGTATIQHNRLISNTAVVRGGGIAVRNGATPTIHNNLIVQNRAGVGGAGISLRNASGTIRNNTIVSNIGLNEGTSDGIFLVQDTGTTSPEILNNIIVNNGYGIRAKDLAQSKPNPSIHHNDVWNNSTADLEGENVISQADANISDDPLFVPGLLGNFYLSHTAAGQAEDSPAIDVGAGTAAELGLDARTTRTDNVADANTADMGYHFRPIPSVSEVIDAFTGGTVTFAEGIDLAVDMPAGVLSESFTLTIGAAEGHPVPEGLAQLGSGFAIDAFDAEGDPITQFSQSFTITIEYDDADVRGLDEGTLQLYYWDESARNSAAGTWKAIPVELAVSENTLIATLDHLTDFALMGEEVDAVAVSTFGEGREGWRVDGDVQRGTGIPDWSAVGGSPGGHVHATDDVEGGTWYWVAPDKFLGDVSAAYSRTLSFDMKQMSEMADQFAAPDIILVGGAGDAQLRYHLPLYPRRVWTHYEIPLHATAGWELLRPDMPTRQPTQTEMLGVLGDLRKLLIRGEFEDGADTGYLDNVVLGGEASDGAVVAPGGSLFHQIKDLSVLVEFPAESLDEPVLVEIDWTEGHPVPDDTLRILGTPFSIEAFAQDDGQSVTQFPAPFTLQISLARVDHQDFSIVKLFYWNEESETWEEVPSTYDASSNILWTTLDHLTEFAIMGAQADHQIYLPQVDR